ncbi:glutamate ligase domain-containing protein [Streptomyces sp. NPDC127110]|uniref:glutamate ligase domain-containing protein n=1 Tax=Streptomyces sp. NPDC127110 TaxID=3345362 RepID=UPI00363EEB8A
MTVTLAAAVGHLNPSWTAGAAPFDGVNGHAGSGLLIAEGDDSGRSVALYRPDVAVVLNADDDHPETFAGTADVVGTLTDFADRARTLVASAHDAGAREVAGRVLDEAPQVLAAGLSGFAGVRRRMQLLGTVAGVRVVDSFAHHPAAIAADIAAADEVLLLPVRDAVPTAADAVSGQGIEHAAVSAGARVHGADGLVQAAEVLAGLARPGDVVLTMGVGAVAGLGALLLESSARPLAAV